MSTAVRAGLDADDLRRTVAASTMTLGGMMKHLALVEDGWFSRSLWGTDRIPPWDAVDWEPEPDREWHTAADDLPEELWGAVAGIGRAGARHNGHADLIREVIDGQTGE